MAMSGAEKDMRMQGTYYIIPESSETLDQQHKPRGSEPDQYLDAGAATIAPLSVGSKLKSPRAAAIRYRECLKNHAANIGGNITDGCGEFMPSGEDGTLEALKCAACNCHRNFHRKETASEFEFGRSTVHPLHLPPALPSPSLNHLNHHRTIHWSSMVPPMKMAFGGGSTAGTDSSSEELNFNAGGVVPPPPGYSKKRFRTKFTQEQKEKMMEFAEKVGWRIPREDDAEVQRFCGELGVKRQVLKVWMHNNKNPAKKQFEDGVNGDSRIDFNGGSRMDFNGDS